MKNKRTIKARFAAALMVALIGLVGTITAAVITSSIQSYTTTHGTGIKSGATEKLTFGAAQGIKSAICDIKPYTGTLYFSAKQTSGKTDKNKATYTICCKKSSASKYSFSKKLTFNKNNIFTKENKVFRVTKGTSYRVLVEKNKGYKYASNLVIDWLVK